jgi:hypothetical protein
MAEPAPKDMFAVIIEDWALAALGWRVPTVPGIAGLADLRVVMAAYRSAESGRVERVTPPFHA